MSDSIRAGYGRLYVSGVDGARNVAGAVWNPRRRAYEVSMTLETLSELSKLVDLDTHCEPTVQRWAKAASQSREVVRALHARIRAGFRTDLPWLDGTGQSRAPFAHQEIMATVACEISGAAFLAEMGTGKTRAAVEALAHHMRRGTIDRVLVVCPARVMKTWEREVATWSTLTAIPLRGPVKDRAEWLGTKWQGNVAVVNYEVLAKLEPFLDGRIGVILDEGHRIRNPQTKVSKAAVKLAQRAKWRLLLTGTPVLQGPHEVWSQWYFVDHGLAFGANYAQFKHEFFDADFWGALQPKRGTIDSVRERMALRGLRYLKKDCLDLPPKVFQRVEVQMSKEQAAAYKTMKEDMIVRMESGEFATAAIALTQMLRLTQITSGFLPDEAGAIHRFPKNPKLEALDEMVRESVTDGHSVIVWAWYKEDTARIADKLRDLGVVKIVGGMSHTATDEAERAFQAGEVPVLVGNPASAGVGLDLWRASTAYYYSQGYSLEHRAQSEDRCHRSGSEIHHSVTYVDVMCEGTIDPLVLAALSGKLTVAQAVTKLREVL